MRKQKAKVLGISPKTGHKVFAPVSKGGTITLADVRKALKSLASITTIPEGTIKRLHVDKQVIAGNRKHGRNDAPLTIQTSKGSRKAYSVKILGPSEFIYRPQKPLSCGARAWIETNAAVQYSEAPV